MSWLRFGTLIIVEASPQSGLSTMSWLRFGESCVREDRPQADFPHSHCRALLVDLVAQATEPFWLLPGSLRAFVHSVQASSSRAGPFLAAAALQVCGRQSGLLLPVRSMKMMCLPLTSPRPLIGNLTAPRITAESNPHPVVRWVQHRLSCPEQSQRQLQPLESPGDSHHGPARDRQESTCPRSR